MRWWLVVVVVVCAGADAEPVETGHYETLGVSVRATLQEIRQAYKKLAVKLHPDKNPEIAIHDKFIKISEAYETLKDPDKRRNYDLYGTNPTYGRRYDSRSQAEYDNLYYNGLYANDLFVDNLNGNTYFNYLSEGFVFVNFYSPFCPPCQKVSDHWKKLAENFKGLVKVAAVNCKYHNSFCYNVMRISSYPSLLFYQNGKNRQYSMYIGDRTYDALEKFVMSFIERDVSIATDEISTNEDLPTAYIIGDSWIQRSTVIRIALHLKGLVNVVRIYDDGLRKRLTRDDYTTVVLHMDGKNKEITSAEEAEIIDVITGSLPALEEINPDKFMKIRSDVRKRSEAKPWVIHFTADNNADKYLAQKLLRKYPDVEFGEIRCDKWIQLCLSLQVDEPPAWAMMKAGGAYERSYAKNNYQDLAQFISDARYTDNVQTLSLSEFNRVIDGEFGLWVLVVAPYKMSWEHLVEPFYKASIEFKHLQFGIMVCTMNSAKYCNIVSANNPVIVVQNGTRRHMFRGENNGNSLVEFIRNLMDDSVIQFTEQRFREVFDSRSKRDSWVVTFYPEFCGRICDHLQYEWNIVARKLRPINFVKVGSIDCSGANKKFCESSNIKHPIIRVYPKASSLSYVAYMQNLGKAPYMLEWLLDFVDEPVQRFTRHSFVNTVLSPNAESLLSDTPNNAPWLIYFHSPRCYHCYELYTDFYITALLLRHSVKVGRLNCLEERETCHQEQIISYPSIKLYTRGSKPIHFVPQQYSTLFNDIKEHVSTLEQRLGEDFGRISLEAAKPGFRHDEF